MNAFFLRAKKLHLWLLVVLALIAAFHLAKHSQPLMNALAEHVTQPMKQTLAALSALVPFSVAEVLIAAALGVLVLYICAFLAALARRHACLPADFRIGLRGPYGLRRGLRAVGCELLYGQLSGALRHPRRGSICGSAGADNSIFRSETQ